MPWWCKNFRTFAPTIKAFMLSHMTDVGVPITKGKADIHRHIDIHHTLVNYMCSLPWFFSFCHISILPSCLYVILLLLLFFIVQFWECHLFPAMQLLLLSHDPNPNPNPTWIVAHIIWRIVCLTKKLYFDHCPSTQQWYARYLPCLDQLVELGFNTARIWGWNMLCQPYEFICTHLFI